MTAIDRQPETEFKRVGELIDLPARLATIDQVRQQRRADRFATHQWPEGTHCAECGDTGYPPETPRTPCMICPIGRQEEDRRTRLARWAALVPTRFVDYSLASHPNRVAANQVRQWVINDAPRGSNLLLSGLTSRGKTGLAVGALRELFAAGKSVRFATVPDLLAALRPRDPGSSGPDVSLYALQASSVLLMDDLGTEKLTEWAMEQIYGIVNGRYERKLPTIVTSNLTIEAIERAVGPRIVSRLREDATILPVTGPDLRSR